MNSFALMQLSRDVELPVPAREASPSVLLVHPDLHAAGDLAEALAESGFSVAVKAPGPTALRFFAAATFDAVIIFAEFKEPSDHYTLDGILAIQPGVPMLVVSEDERARLLGGTDSRRAVLSGVSPQDQLVEALRRWLGRTAARAVLD